MLNANVVKFEAYLKSTLKYAAVGNVLQLGIHYSVAFSRLTVLKVNTLPNATIHADASSDFDFL